MTPSSLRDWAMATAIREPSGIQVNCPDSITSVIGPPLVTKANVSR
jgi:hypothetical protein